MTTARQLWTRELSGWVAYAPVVADASIRVRSGGDLVSIDTASGTVEWTTSVDPTGEKGQLLAIAGDMTITTRSQDATTVLVGTSPTGQVVWENPTAMFIGDAWLVDDLDFVCFGHTASERRFVRVNGRSGEVTHCEIVQSEPDQLLLAAPNRLLGVASSGPGIVELDDMGKPRATLFEPAVDMIAPFDDGFVVAIEAGAAGDIRRLDAHFEDVWQIDARSTILAGGPTSLVIDDAIDAPGSVGSRLRRLDGDGQVAWTSALITDAARHVKVLNTLVAVTGLTSVTLLSGSDGSIHSDHFLGLTAIDIAGGYIVVEANRLTAYSLADS